MNKAICIVAAAAPVLALFFVTALLTGSSARSSPIPQDNAAAGFMGTWCAQGDSSKQTSITNNGVFLRLTNESGSTSIGHMQGNTIVADEWQFVQGNLTPDGNRINWSNGTFWARCNSGGGGGGGGRRPNIDGTWYQSGNRSKACYIKQRKSSLKLTNEVGDTATGQIDGKRHLTTNWNGVTIGGTIVSSGDRINWDNGTYWTR